MIIKNIRNIDLHMHSTVSDGTDTPEELISRVREKGLELFALTDHDSDKGYGRILKALAPEDPQPLSGVEFSCRDEEGKYHILGYGFDPDSPSIRKLVETGHRFRMKKVMVRLEGLKSIYNITFPEEEIQQLLSMDNPGKPHIGNLMVKYGYADNKDAAIRDFINTMKIRSEYVRPEDAIQGILKGGGIPVLAHPPFGSGEQRIVGEEMEHRLRRLTGYGLQGVEAFYSRFTPGLQAEMLSFAEKYELYVTAGSDYHGSNKPVILGDTGLANVPEIPEGMKHFLEAVGVQAESGN